MRDKGKRLLHVVNVAFVLPYFIGDQIAFLRNKGFYQAIVASYSEELIRYGGKHDVPIFPISITRSFSVLKDIKSVNLLVRLIKKEKFNIVIGHTPKGALLSMIAAYITKVPQRVYFRHGIMYETSKGLKRILLKNIERLTARLATKVVCVSPSVMEVSKKDRLSKSTKNILLNRGTCNGIDLNRFTPSNAIDQELLRQKLDINVKDFVVGYVGRLVRDKGIVELVKSWQLLIARFPNVRLLLVGPFEERDALPEEIKDYILNEPSVIFTGLVEDTVPYYKIMDMFILPSYREGFPTVVLEASAMEVPVLTTRVTGCVDSIVEGESGEYIECSPQAICERIMELGMDREKLRRYGAFGRKWVKENFDQKVIWDRIYEEVLRS